MESSRSEQKDVKQLQYADRFGQEAAKHEIELKDDSPLAVNNFLRYLYTFEVGAISFINLLNLFALADKYGVGGLEKETKSRILNWLTPCKIRDDPFQHYGNLLCDLAERIWKMKQPGMTEIRTAYLDLLFLNLGHFLKSSKLQSLFTTSPDFCTELLQAMYTRGSLSKS